jgi:ABC-type sugar transport system ATPase subunit
MIASEGWERALILGAGGDPLAEIRLERLSKGYGGGAPVLDAVDVTIPSGELLVVLGPSGSGKTTLLRLIAGLESPTSGRVWIDGRDATGVRPDRRDVAMVFQQPALYPHLTVFDNLAFGLRARGFPRNQMRSRVNMIAGLLGLDALLARRPGALSGGERQRVAIGRAIVRQPRVLLFDEPFSSLDLPLRAALREEVVALHRRFATTWILVTHDQAEALQMGDRVAVLDRGRLLQCGPPRAIYERPTDRFVATFVGNPPMNILSCEVERNGEGHRIHFIAARHGLSWVMPDCKGPAGWPEGLDQVELGLRPEAIDVRVDGPAEAIAATSPTLPAQVRRVEFNGHELLATLALGPHLLVARLPSSRPIPERQGVQVVLDLDRAVWFDPATGRALYGEGAGTVSST